MARVFQTGFEAGSAAADKALNFTEDGGTYSTGASFAFSTTTVDSVGLSLQLKGGNQSNNLQCYLGGTGQYFTRLRFMVSSFDSGGSDWWALGFQGSSTGVIVKMSSAGVLNLVDYATTTTVAASMATISTGVWHVLEMSYVPTTGATVVRLDGTQIGSGTGAVAGANLSGYVGQSGNAQSVFVDDWAVNDTTGSAQTSWCGAGRLCYLVPASDSSVTGFTAGAGGTTSLFAAVKAKPPVGVVLASATNTSQVKDVASNTTDTYVATLQTLSAAGVPSATTVVLAQAFAAIGNSTTTSRTLGLTQVTNPAIGSPTEATGTTGATAAATYPTGWTTLSTAIAYSPTISGAPTTRLRKGTASTDAAMSCFMALLVEYVVTNVSLTSTASDSVATISDAATVGVRGFKRPTAETVAVSDAVTFVRSLQKPTADTVAVSDAVARTYHTARTSADTVSVSDTVAGGRGASRPTADTVAVSDANTLGYRGYARPTGDTVPVSDSAGRFYHTARSTGDVVSVTDLVVGVRATARATVDAVGAISDLVMPGVGRVKFTVDTFAVSDAVMFVVRKTNITPQLPVPQAPSRGLAAGADFTYRAFDLLTGRPIGQVPMRDVSFGSQLNSPQTGTFTFDMMDPRVLACNPIACTAPNRTFVTVDYRGVLLWGGIVQTRRPTRTASGSDTTNTVVVQAAEPWTWFQQRMQATDYSAPPYSGINPNGMQLWAESVWDAGLVGCQVLVDALSYSQAVYNPYANILGGLGVLYNGVVPSGMMPQAPPADWVNVTFPYTSLQSVDTIFSQLADLGMGVGFDFGVDLSWSAGVGSRPRGIVNLSYPRRGAYVAQNNLMLDCATARQYEFPEDGTQMANQIYEIGGSSAIVVDTNPSPLDQGYPLWERSMSRANAQSVDLMNMLAQVAESDSAMYSYPVVTPTVTVGLFDQNIGLTYGGLPFVAGDDVQLLIPALAQDGTVFDPRFPAGLNQEWRITGWTATVPNEGDPTLTLDLAQPPLSVMIAPAI